MHSSIVKNPEQSYKRFVASLELNLSSWTKEQIMRLLILESPDALRKMQAMTENKTLQGYIQEAITKVS